MKKIWSAIKIFWSFIKKIFVALIVVAVVAALVLSFIAVDIGAVMFFMAILVVVLFWALLQYQSQSIVLFIDRHHQTLERIRAVALVIIIAFYIFIGITSLIKGDIFMFVVCLLGVATLILLFKNNFLRTIKDLRKKGQ
jgi:hypothetical protein